MHDQKLRFLDKNSVTVDFEKYSVPVPDALGRAGFGKHITRTMSLLSGGTFEKPNLVKIAFTGQSITDPNNTWPSGLTEWLKKQYPAAEIMCRNFAIGGFSTNFLYKRMPNDMASFYPDLIIMYDMGSHIFYEQMLKWLRDNTTAEIMIQTEHYCGENEWADTMSYTHLPEFCRKYEAELCDIRTPWKNFIMNNGLEAGILTYDGTHLNSSGQQFMLELMKQFFVKTESGPERAARQRFVPVETKDWINGKLTLPFTGNRVEIVPGDGPQHPVSVRIDGKKPSEIKEAYIRTSENIGIQTRLGLTNFNLPPGEQIFTVTIKSFNDPENFTYSVDGYKTGHEGISDGHGVLDGKYLSFTGESFIFHPGAEKPSSGQHISFETLLNGTDFFGSGNPYAGHEAKKELFNENMLISGINTGEHTLELEAEKDLPDIRRVIVYNPKA